MGNCNKGCAPYSGGWIVPPFWHFTNYVPTVPKLYWNVRSQEQRILNLFELMNKVICYADTLGENVNELYEITNQIKADFEAFKNGEMVDYYIEVLEKWINDHMPDIMSQAMRIVYFGLTLEGYFVGYVPQGNAWDGVMFDTGADYNLDTYGRLMLFYETDANSTVWQSENTQGVTTQLIAQITDLERRVARNERRVAHNEDTLYDPLLEGE